MYESVRVSKRLHRAHYAQDQKDLRRCAATLQSFDTRSKISTSDVARFSFANTLLEGRARSGHPVMDTVTTFCFAPLLADLLCPRAWLPLWLTEDNLMPYATAGLGVAFGVTVLFGCGVNGHEMGVERPPPPSKIDSAARFGLFGAAEGIGLFAAEKLHQRKYHRMAAACTVAAAICAIPVEIARVSVFATVYVLQWAQALTLAMFTTAYSVVRHKYAPTAHPKTFVPLLERVNNHLYQDRAKAFKKERQARAGLGKVSTWDASRLSQREAERVQLALQKMEPVLGAPRAADVRPLLETLSSAEASGASGVAAGAEPLTAEMTELEKMLVDAKSRARVGRNSLFDTQLRQRINTSLQNAPTLRVWENTRFRQVSLALHPDKLDPQKTLLTPQARRLGDALYGLVSSLRQFELPA